MGHSSILYSFTSEKDAIEALKKYASYDNLIATFLQSVDPLTLEKDIADEADYVDFIDTWNNPRDIVDLEIQYMPYTLTSKNDGIVHLHADSEKMNSLAHEAAGTFHHAARIVTDYGYMPHYGAHSELDRHVMRDYRRLTQPYATTRIIIMNPSNLSWTVLESSLDYLDPHYRDLYIMTTVTGDYHI